MRFMRKRMSLWAAAVLVIAVPPAAVAAESQWQVQDSAPWGTLTAVAAGPEAFGTWAFGVGPHGGSFAVHAVGEFAEKWTSAPVPDVGRVHHAHGGWAVGDRGALRWVEGAWRRVPFATRPGVTTSLRVVETEPLDKDRAWAVGVETATRWQRGVVQHWDGSRWTPVQVPAGVLDASSELTGVLPWVDGVVYAFGVDHDRSGDRVLVLRYDGRTWTRLSAPHRPGYDEHVAGHTPDSARLVGWTAPAGAPPSARRPLVYAVDQETGGLTAERTPDVAAELTASATEYGTPIAVGHTAAGRPFAVRLWGDPADVRWEADPMPDVRGRLLAVSGMVVPNIWAVGGTTSGRPLVLRNSP